MCSSSSRSDGMKKIKLLPLWILILVFLLSGCVRQPSEQTNPGSAQNVSSETEPTKPDPQPTQEPETGESGAGDGHSLATTAPAMETEPPATTEQTEPTTLPEETEPTETTSPSEETEPTEVTEATEPASSPEVDEDELPPMPVG